ncbi:hypothetical protein Y788_10430 [Pantoea dispersa 625]|nr:hypothetical protein Y788_10430 [Pantoea dispersa 625]
MDNLNPEKLISFSERLLIDFNDLSITHTYSYFMPWLWFRFTYTNFPFALFITMRCITFTPYFICMIILIIPTFYFNKIFRM